jgi:alkaline phosphatase D
MKYTTIRILICTSYNTSFHKPSFSLNNVILKNTIAKNTIFLTGDSHASWSFDLTKKPAIYPNAATANLPTPSPSYTASTGNGSVGVEFATPSITSANFDEAIGKATTAQFEYLINNPVTVGPPFGSVVYNPHLKYVDLDRHGYFILDLKDDSAQADYFYVDTLRISSNKEKFGRGVVTANNSNRITRLSSFASIGKSIQEGQAPSKPQPKATGVKELKSTEAIIIGAYPIPAFDLLSINYALNKSGVTEIAIFDIGGTATSI